jgi:hypothetical protein
MNEDVKNIIDQLTEKLSLQNKTTEELRAIAERYPYFGFPKFLLAKKMSEEEVAASKELQQAAFHFSNPFWLNYLLSKDASPLHEVTNKTPVENAKEEVGEETTPTLPQDDFFEEQHAATGEISSVDQPIPSEETTVAEERYEELISEASYEQTATEVAEEEIIIPETEYLGEEVKSVDETTNAEIENVEVSTEVSDEVRDNETDTGKEAEAIDENAALPNVPIETSQAETENVETSTEVTDAIQDDEQEPEAINEEHEKLSQLIAQHLSEFKKPLEGSEDIPLETRVYHAIDYFASQGIKLDPRLITQDMLGSKVKKFTDWLKQMKRLNQNPTDLGTDIETEHLIEKIAQSSNETKEVITETMADVLVKQGKIEKAIQLYQKLSFLNPGKYAYFAAKINELKGLQ